VFGLSVFMRNFKHARVHDPFGLGVNAELFAQFAHLEKFYGQISFQKINEAQAPAFLRERFLHMRRDPPEDKVILEQKF